MQVEFDQDFNYLNSEYVNSMYEESRIHSDN
jgi:hypothetical protein